jgi:hypothetical protein
MQLFPISSHFISLRSKVFHVVLTLNSYLFSFNSISNMFPVGYELNAYTLIRIKV